MRAKTQPPIENGDVAKHVRDVSLLPSRSGSFLASAEAGAETISREAPSFSRKITGLMWLLMATVWVGLTLPALALGK